MEKKHTRGSFTGSIGFVLAAAGSAVGLGNIWRFPYLAAKDGGGTFILVYIVLALTFGFTLLTTDIAIGRKTGQSPLVAYGKIHPGWNGLGLLASIVPVVILPYYCSIGGWVLKYLSVCFSPDMALLLPRMVTLPAILPVHGSRLCGWESIFFLPHSLYIVVSIRELKTTAKF